MHIIFEVIDIHCVFANIISIRLDDLLHRLLTGAEVINHESEWSIDRVILLQFFIHLFSFDAKIEYLLLSWSNISSQLFDFVVKYKFELLQLLRLFLEIEDLLLILGNQAIFKDNFITLLLVFLSQGVDYFFGRLILLLLMLDLIYHSINFFLHLFQFRACELQLSARSQTHILDLTKTGLVFRLYLINLLFRIVIDLMHSLLIISFKSNYLVLELLNLVLLNFNIILMSSLFTLYFSSMHFKHVCLSHSELCGFFLSLVLELLIASCIFEHLLWVVISLGFQLIMVLLS